MNFKQHILLNLVLACLLAFVAPYTYAIGFPFEKMEFSASNVQAETMAADDKSFTLCNFYHQEESEFSFRNQTSNRQIKKESIRFNFENHPEPGTKITVAYCTTLRSGYYNFLFLHYLF